MKLINIAKEKLRELIKYKKEFFLNSTKLDGELLSNIKPNLIICYSIVIFTIAVFGLWSSLAPIESAVIAQGNVIVSSERQLIQHLEGGVIEKIHVKDGQFIKKDDPLVEINSTSYKSNLHILEHQLMIAKINETRLTAEIAKEKELVFDEPIIASSKDDKEIYISIMTQQNLFKTNVEYYNNRVKLLEDQIEQTKEKISNLHSISLTIQEQTDLLKTELDNFQKLFDKKLIEYSRLSEIKRRYAELQGRKGEMESRILEANDIISQTKNKLYNLELEYQKNLTDELKEIQTKVSDLNDKVIATKDVVTRSVITSPVSGIVNGLEYHTIGGVIKPGVKIMEIVPQDLEMIIEGKVKANDISYIFKGQNAQILLTAYKTRYINKIKGEVTYVSADRYLDDNNQPPYYKIKVSIKEEDLKQDYKTLELYPGMPVQIFLVTGSKTLLQYLFEPLYVGFNKGFREE